MNLTKSYEFFQPEKNTARLHIIGCGSVGSTVAENLARCGVTKITLWDFDTVEPKNIANQMFREKDIGKPKVDALKDIILEINPDAEADIEVKPEGWQGKMCSGYIFMCVDSIELRKQIVERHFNSPNVKAIFDFRTLLESAQLYAADWSSIDARKNMLTNVSSFTHEEAAEETPVSACGTVLGVATTVRVVSALGVNNYINFVKGNGLKTMMIVDAFKPDLFAI